MRMLEEYRRAENSQRIKDEPFVREQPNMKTTFLKDDSVKEKSGYLKFETADNIITSAVLLKPKLYSIKTVGVRKMAAKGVSMKNIDPIPHKKFEEILEDSTVSVIRP